MRWLYLVVCALVLVCGCEAIEHSEQWEEFRKDLRGDNMRMKMGENWEGLPKPELDY
jgi:hypothetical protein